MINFWLFRHGFLELGIHLIPLFLIWVFILARVKLLVVGLMKDYVLDGRIVEIKVSE